MFQAQVRVWLLYFAGGTHRDYGRFKRRGEERSGMSKGNVVKVGDGVEYEAEVLTASTEPGAKDFAIAEFWDYVSNKWGWDDEKKAYNDNTIKSRRERKLFDGIYRKMAAVLASDKNGVFESAESLYDFARNSPGEFETIYQLVIKTNPTLVPEEIDPN
jgi:hypothetical protein